MRRDSFLMYRSFVEALNELPDDQRLHLYDAIASYSLNGEEPELKGSEKVIFMLILPQLKANNQKYMNGKQPKSKDEASDKQSEANNKQSESKAVANENENENENENGYVKTRTHAREFSKPTLEEVKAYIQEKGYSVNGDRFFNYYESNGWKVGRNAMKSWQAAVRSWQADRQDDYLKHNYTDEQLNKIAADVESYEGEWK